MQLMSMLVSTVLSAAAMPAIIRFADVRQLYDGVAERKIHSGQVPRLGGMGIFLAFFLAAAVVPFFGEAGLSGALGARLDTLVPLAVGAVLVYGIGLWDDFTGGKVRAIWKLIVQIVAAVIVVGQGLRFSGLGFSVDGFSGSLRWASSALTCFWIVGVTNAINLIDGMDGLAGGISFIGSLTYAVFYYLAGDQASSFICLCLSGAIAGFLTVNFPAPKAKLFMGDSGSLFLGFCLASMPLLGEVGGAAAKTVGVVPAALLLFVPIYDTLRAIWRRKRAGVSIATADRLHIHHLFWDAGYKPISILAILYSATLWQAAVFIVASRMSVQFAFLAELIGFLLTGILFRYAASLGSASLRSNKVK